MAKKRNGSKSLLQAMRRVFSQPEKADLGIEEQNARKMLDVDPFRFAAMLAKLERDGQVQKKGGATEARGDVDEVGDPELSKAEETLKELIDKWQAKELGE